MTINKNFKRLVRARMEQTGESYTTALAALKSSPRPTQKNEDVTPPPASSRDSSES